MLNTKKFMIVKTLNDYTEKKLLKRANFDCRPQQSPPQGPPQGPPQAPEEPQQCVNDRFLDFIRGPHSCGLLRSDFLDACNDLINVNVR